MPRIAKEYKWKKPEKCPDIKDFQNEFKFLSELLKYFADYILYSYDQSSLFRLFIQGGTVTIAVATGFVAIWTGYSISVQLEDWNRERILKSWNVIAEGVKVKSDIGQKEALEIIYAVAKEKAEKLKAESKAGNLDNIGKDKYKNKTLVQLKRINLSYANLVKIEFDEKVSFRESCFYFTDFYKSKLGGAKFKKSFLKKVDFKSAYLVESDFRYANLNRAKLMGADLRRADLRGADLSRAELGMAKTLPEEIDKKKYKLEGWGSKLTELRGAKLKGADLRGVNFENANLEDADLRGAFFTKDEALEIRGNTDERADDLPVFNLTCEQLKLAITDPSTKFHKEHGITWGSDGAIICDKLLVYPEFEKVDQPPCAEILNLDKTTN
ncbi:MAG: pentapeptide repeat-containing protein [Nitrospina sp.]|jgi:uncharacterized protein YjbI with pentapeptide repeats|nr:pentapeptide repeat-containing protein [Nitrospina sp.]MBT5632237.1 pentapeptide repeat-containing protein [Nitrospina sp.]